MPSYSLQTGSLALAAATTKSLILLNPNISVYVAEFGVSFDGTAAAQGVRVDLYRTTTVGSPTGTTGVPVKFGNSVAASSACTSLTALTAEPTAVEILGTWFVSPACGVLVVPYATGYEPHCSGTSSNRIGVRVTTPTSVTPNCAGYLVYKE